MCAHPSSFRLAFLPRVGLLVPPGRHQPCLAGCVLAIDRAGLVTIEGPSRERVFDQARRFLRVNSKGCPAYSVTAILSSAAGRDSWSIIVGAEIAFSPTSLPAATPQEQLTS